MRNEEIESCIQTLRFLENNFINDHGIFMNDKHPDNIEKIIKFLKEKRWIPVCERLPEASGEYLVRPSDAILEDYSDFSEVMIMPYDADCEAFGWWREKYDPVSLGYLDSEFGEFEVLAWMPLPQPYIESEGEK